MSDPILEKINAWLKDHEQDLVNDLVSMLRIPSLESEPEPNAPFGAENRKALDLALELSEKYGFRTHDVEGYIGWAEIGEGEKMVLSLGHLDVVPVGPGWKHEPFGAEIDGGYIYARGAIDDKGPTMASFYALRAIKECAPHLKVRFRQAFGCNEESGFRCIDRYVETEEIPWLGVAPDSGWPLYHGEKGIATFWVKIPGQGPHLEFLELDGGQRPNIVVDSCSAKVRFAPEAMAWVKGKLEDAWDRNVTFAWDGDVLGLFATGKAAHGSTPYFGDNAVERAIRFVREIAPPEAEDYMDNLLLALHPSGVGLGIHGSDEPSRDLTSNIGVSKVEGGEICLMVNVRYPVTWKNDEIWTKLAAQLEKLGWTSDELRDSPGLYFPLDHPLVKTVCEVYEAETGEKKAPGVMGGGTYARAIANTVSIGTGWAGDGPAHETDERLKVEHLHKMARIYAHIFYRLGLLGS